MPAGFRFGMQQGFGAPSPGVSNPSTGDSYRYQNAHAAAAASRFSVDPPRLVAKAIDTLCGGLDTDGVFSALDICYIHALHHPQAGMVNLAQNRFDATAVNSPNFSEFEGYAGDGSTSRLDTGFNATTATSISYARDAATIFFWPLTSLANGGGNSQDIGQGNARMGRSSGNGLATRANAGSTDTLLGTSAYPGLIAFTRTASNSYRVYKNGVDAGGGTTVSAALVNETFKVCSAGFGGYGVNRIAASGFGGILDATQHAALYAHLHAALSDPAIGAI